MSLLANAFGARPRPSTRSPEQLSALIDPTWIAQALGNQRQVSIRRKLPAETVACDRLALFRDRPLWQAQQLDLSLMDKRRPHRVSALPAPGRAAWPSLFGLLTQAWSRPGGECASHCARAGCGWCGLVGAGHP